MSDSSTQARAQVDSIVEMMAAVECDYDLLRDLRDERDAWQADEDTAGKAWGDEYPSAAEELSELSAAAGDCEDRDDAEQRVHEDPLSVETRSGWHAPGSAQDGEGDEEFRILLCTGGPHVELRGDLDQYGSPSRVYVVHKNWGTNGEMSLHGGEQTTVLAYCALVLGA